MHFTINLIKNKNLFPVLGSNQTQAIKPVKVRKVIFFKDIQNFKFQSAFSVSSSRCSLYDVTELPFKCTFQHKRCTFLFTDPQLQGYVHTLSSIQSSSKSNIKYFDFKLQTSEEESVRMVCYSPEKRMKLQQHFKNKSPVKIQGTKRSRTKDNEYSISKTAKIAPSAVPFPYNDVAASQLHTRKECLEATLYDKVDVKARVISKSEEKQPGVYQGKTKYKVDCLIADATKSIKIALWEDAISKVAISKSYYFQNLTVRIFDDNKYLNTNEATIIDEIADIHEINLSSPTLEDNVVKAKCIGVEMKKSLSCLVCNFTLEEIESSAEKTITCPNCKITTLRSSTKRKLVCQLLIEIDDSILSFTCFNDAMQSFLKCINYQTPIQNIEVSELQKLLLTTGPHEMVVNRSQRLVSQFLRANQQRETSV